MTTPPPPLGDLLRTLSLEIPSRFATLLSAGGFARGQAAVAALAEPGRIEAVLADLKPDEAAWIAGELDRRWARLVPHPSDTVPPVRLRCADRVWLAGNSADLALIAEVEGLDEGWEMTWPDRARPLGPGAAALTVTAEDAPWLTVRIDVAGRRAGSGARDVLHAARRVAVMRPGVSITPDRLLLCVHDGLGTPAAGIEIGVDAVLHRLDAAGVLRLATPLPPTAALTLDGWPLPMLPEET
jgi:hypothetical protein